MGNITNIKRSRCTDRSMYTIGTYLCDFEDENETKYIVETYGTNKEGRHKLHVILKDKNERVLAIFSCLARCTNCWVPEFLEKFKL